MNKFPYKNQWMNNKIKILSVVLLITCALSVSVTVNAASIKTSNYKKTEFKKNEILVKFKKKASSRTKSNINAKIKAKIHKHFKYSNLEHIKLPKNMSVQKALKFYRNNSSVEYAEPNYKRSLQSLPNDPDFINLWGLNNTGQEVNGIIGTNDADIDASEAWDLSTGSTDVVVAVLDTGIDYTHPDIAPNMWTNPYEIAGNGIDDDSNGYIDDVYGIQTGVTGPAEGDPKDTDDHGTHVAGTIGAKGNNAIGVAGINWDVKIMAINIMGADNAMYSSDIIEALNYVKTMKERGVNIVATNNSYGGGTKSTAEETAITGNKNANILFIAAAGNSSQNNDIKPMYPASYNVDNIIAVAATDSSDNLASFSSYGPTSVDIAAPGVNILSTIPPGYLTESSVIESDTTYYANGMDYAGYTDGITKAIYNSGKGLTAADFPPEVNGNIALIERGNITFAEKTTNAQNAGAVGVIIYNNVPGGFYGTLGSAGDWVPVVAISKADGLALAAKGTPTVTLINKLSDKLYDYKDGTSMSTPHVTGVAALVSAYHPEFNYMEIKNNILNNGDKLDSLNGKVASGSRLNALNALAPNMLKNSSFEIDSDLNSIPDSWTPAGFTTGDGRSVDFAKAGSYSLKIVSAAKLKKVTQTISLSGNIGDKFTLSGWNKNVGTTGNGTCIRAYIYLNNIDGTRTSVSIPFNRNPHNWTKSSVNVTANKSFSSIDILIANVNQTGVAYFDDFRLVKIF